MKQGVLVVCLAGLLGAARTAHAYRPFDGTDADVASLGELELEIGPVGYLREGREGFLTAPAIVVNLGVLPRVELVAEGTALYSLDAARADPRARFADPGLFLKAVLRNGALQDASGPSIAVEAGPLLPAGAGETEWGVEGTLIVSQRWSFGTVHVNLSAARTRAGRGEGFLGAILEGPDDWRLRPVAEAFYEREIGAERTWSLLGGGVLRIDDDLSLDAAARWGRADATNALEIRAGLTWTLHLWRPR